MNKPAPATLAVAAPNNGAIKRGDKIEVKVTVARVNGYMGPIELTLPLPPGVVGLTAAPVTIPADKNEGVLVIQAAAEEAGVSPETVSEAEHTPSLMTRIPVSYTHLTLPTSDLV